MSKKTKKWNSKKERDEALNKFLMEILEEFKKRPDIPISEELRQHIKEKYGC